MLLPTLDPKTVTTADVLKAHAAIAEREQFVAERQAKIAAACKISKVDSRFTVAERQVALEQIFVQAFNQLVVELRHGGNFNNQHLEHLKKVFGDKDFDHNKPITQLESSAIAAVLKLSNQAPYIDCFQKLPTALTTKELKTLEAIENHIRSEFLTLFQEQVLAIGEQILLPNHKHFAGQDERVVSATHRALRSLQGFYQQIHTQPSSSNMNYSSETAIVKELLTIALNNGLNPQAPTPFFKHSCSRKNPYQNENLLRATLNVEIADLLIAAGANYYYEDSAENSINERVYYRINFLYQYNPNSSSELNGFAKISNERLMQKTQEELITLFKEASLEDFCRISRIRSNDLVSSLIESSTDLDEHFVLQLLKEAHKKGYDFSAKRLALLSNGSNTNPNILLGSNLLHIFIDANLYGIIPVKIVDFLLAAGVDPQIVSVEDRSEYGEGMITLSLLDSLNLSLEGVELELEEAEDADDRDFYQRSIDNRRELITKAKKLVY